MPVHWEYKPSNEHLWRHELEDFSPAFDHLRQHKTNRAAIFFRAIEFSSIDQLACIMHNHCITQGWFSALASPAVTTSYCRPLGKVVTCFVLFCAKRPSFCQFSRSFLFILSGFFFVVNVQLLCRQALTEAPSIALRLIVKYIAHCFGNQ